MTPEHLETLTASLATMKELRARISAVADELNQAFYDQSGEWRFSAEADAASEEIIPIEEIVRQLDASIEELREFSFCSRKTRTSPPLSATPRPRLVRCPIAGRARMRSALSHVSPARFPIRS